ncbi:hypothetical protein [Bdellovibrio sp. HCB2-146]|uniref:hypothetical protein n=1 Tax=Bdellovibrio sp. HCB2-146 TaxID=3394362 RepID=UPI0039BD1CA8
MLKTVFFIFITLGFYSNSYACPFEGMTLTSIEDSPDFTSTPSDWVSYPTRLFKGFSNLLDMLSPSECKEAVIANQITDNKTGIVYTAFYTNDDSCDGGNSYGMIVEGKEPRLSKAVASIQDSDIACVK